MMMMKSTEISRYKFITLLLWRLCCVWGVIICLYGVVGISRNSNTVWANYYSFNTDEDITVKSVIDKRSLYVGQPGQLQIYVNGSRSPAPPVLPDIDGVEFNYLGGQDRSSSSVTIINGRRTEKRFDGYIFIYEIVASKAGEIVIPPVSVFVERKEYKSNELTIRIMEPVERDDIKVGITVDNVTPFVGEPVLFTVTLYLNTPIQGVEFRFPGLLNQFEVYDLPDDNNNSGSRSRITSQPQQMLDLLGTSTPVEFGQARINGRTVTTCTLQKYIVARQPGSQTLGPGVVNCDVVISRARGFFDSDRTESVVVPSNSLEVDVEPLPDIDKPPHFSGLIGRYKIETQASPTSVGIGDPINLEIRISRVDGPVLHEPKLDLNAQPGFAQDFRVPEDMPDPDNINGVIVYKQTIRAVHSDMSEIPALELVYFNIDKGKYETAKSRPIPLDVHDTKVVTARDAVGGIGGGVAGGNLNTGDANESNGTGGGIKIDDTAKGIAYNYESTEALVNQRFNLLEKLREPLWTTVLVVPPAFYAIISLTIFFTKRSRKYELVRIRRAALTNAINSLKSGVNNNGFTNDDNANDWSVDLAHVIYRYFADKFTLPQAGITTEDCVAKVMNYDNNIAESLADILHRCDGARYGGFAQSEVKNIYESAINILHDIDQAIGKKHNHIKNGGAK